MSRRHRLTASLQVGIVSGIRAGADAHSAAEAWDVPRAVFDQWLAWGQRETAREPYRSFADQVRTALAQAKARADMEILKEAPRVWLEKVRSKDNPETADNPLLNRMLMELIGLLMKALTPYPEARAAVAKALMDSELLPDFGVQLRRKRDAA